MNRLCTRRKTGLRKGAKRPERKRCGPGCTLTLRRVAATALLALALAPSSAPGAPAPKTAESFPLLSRRNIFDPTRRPHQIVPTRSAPPRSKPPETEYVALTGTLLYADKAYAFLAGSGSSFQPVVRLNERVAIYAVAEITTTNVVLAAGSARIVLPVGGRMLRRQDGGWEPAAGEAQSAAGGGAVTGPAPPAADTGTAADVNDLMKQMMERRKKELSR
ncbi:MAG: hypothetical protein JXR37_33700 [Kiritimatiellae bacterium]|nr:hypothetical protein [Kiritimatiellia bacterium]